MEAAARSGGGMSAAAMWSDRTREVVSASLADCRKLCNEAREQEHEELERWFESGNQLTSGTQGDLIRKEAEEDEDWDERKKRFASINIAARIVEAMAGWIRARNAKRTLGLSEEIDRRYAEELKRSRIGLVEKDRAIDQVLHGEHYQTFGWDQSAARVAIVTVKPQNGWFIPSAWDPLRMETWIERRQRPNDSRHPIEYRKWNALEYEIVDEDWKPIAPSDGIPQSGPNPFGLIPTVRTRGISLPGEKHGLSLVRDAVKIQKLITNHVSELDVLLRHQTGDWPFVRSARAPEIVKGAGRALHLTGEKDEVGYASPNAKLMELIEALSHFIEWGFEITGQPLSVFKGEAASSGFELMVKYQAALRVAHDYCLEIEVAEEDFARVFCAVARYGKLPFPEPSKVKPGLSWEGSMLPADEAAARDADGRDVAAGRMTLEDYLRRNRKDLKPEEIEPYAAKLRQEEDAKAAREASRFSGGGVHESNGFLAGVGAGAGADAKGGA